MIELSADEQTTVERFIRRGQANARNIMRAHMLLKSAEGWSIERIAEAYGVSQATVSNVRARYRAGGVDRVLKDKGQQKRRRVLAGADEAVLVAIACSRAGRA
jgi:transposase